MRRTGLLILVLLPLLTSCGVMHAAVGEKRYRQISPAMEPTVPRNTTVTAKVIKAGAYQPVDGDIVVFQPPSDWETEPTHAARIYRVVAIPGETIQCCDPAGRLERNGKPVDEPYVARGNGSEPFGRVEVGAGQIFLLGDNRPSAADSRDHGLLPADKVTGVVKTG